MRKLLALLMLLPFLVALLFPGRASAAQPSIEPLNLIFIIDDSGSMAQSDPQSLRLEAAKLIISLLKPEDAVAVIRFATNSQVLAPFAPMTTEAKRSLSALLDAGFRSQGRTDIRAALAQAKDLLQAAPTGLSRVILLTDGSPDWEAGTPSADELQAYLMESVSIAQSLGTPVLTVALGQAADRDFLHSISAATQGQDLAAATALDLPAVYLSMLAELRGRTIVGPGPVDAPGETTIEAHPFAQSVGFVVVKDPSVGVSLYEPGSAEPLDLTATGVSAFQDSQFEVIVVSDIRPGSWRVALDGGGRANVQAIAIASRLEIELVSPGGPAACAGAPLSIHARVLLQERDGTQTTIAGDALPEGLSAKITLPNGQRQNMRLLDKSNAGLFGAQLDPASAAGHYQLVVQTGAGGLETSRSSELELRACPGLTLLSPAAGVALTVAPGRPVTVEAALVGGEGLPLDQGQIVATVRDGSGHEVTQVLSDAGSGRYRGEFLPGASGPATIKIQFTNAVWQGLSITAQTDPVTISINRPVLPTATPWPTPRPSPVPAVPAPQPASNPWPRVLAMAAGAMLAVLALGLLWRRARQPKLEGELSYDRPGTRPVSEPVSGRRIYLKVQDGSLAIGRRKGGAQAVLEAERDGDGVAARLRPLAGARISKNNLPLGQDGCRVRPNDLFRLDGQEIRFTSYLKED